MLEAVQQSIYICWLVVSTPLKNISQLGLWFPIYGKIKNVPNHQPDMFWTHFKNAHPLHPFLWFCPAFSSNDQGVSRGFDPFIPKRGQASARWKDASRASFDLERCRGWESHRTPAPAFSWSLRLESSGFFNGFWVIQFLESAQVH